MDKNSNLIIRTLTTVAEWTKSFSLPGFNKVPLYDVAVFFIRGIDEGAITTRASSIAFNFFLALFPAIIFFFTLIPFISSINFQYEILGLLKDVMPSNAYETVKETLEDIVTNQRGSLLSFGFFAALYFSTTGFGSMIEAFNNSYHLKETRTWLSQKVISIILVLIMTILITTAVILVVFSETALNYLVKLQVLRDDWTIYLLSFGKWIIILALMFSAISLLYYFAPVKRDKWKLISAGSTFATILTIATSICFSYYINNFGSYNKLYGSIGTVLVILVWLYFNALVLIIGFELNGSIRNAHRRDKVLNNG